MYSFKFRKKYFHAIALFIEVAAGILIIKVEKILKGSMDSIPSPSVKIQIIGGKVYLR